MNWKVLQTDSPQDTKKPFRKNGISIVVCLLVVSIIAFFLVRKVSEYDIWYHMAVGQEILRNGSLPATDQLSLLNLGQPYHARLWLFRILAAAGYRLAGFWWLQALQTGLWGLTLWLVYRSTRIWTSATTACLLLLVTAIACEERFTIRPELVSYAMVAAYYWRLQQGKYRSFADLALFFVLQEVWTNSHGLFSIGPFLVGCYFVAAVIKGKQGEGYDEARSLSILLCVTAAGCIVTPTGLDSLKYTWQLITTVSPQATMVNYNMIELASPLGSLSRTFTAFWFYFALLAAFPIGLIAVALHCRQQLSLARTLIGCAMLATSMTGIRNMPLFAIVAAPLIAENLSQLDSARLRRICGATAAVVVIIAALVWSPRPALTHLGTWVPYRFGVGMSSDYVPLGLPAFLDQIGFSGPIFNSQTLGGFYEYQGSPKRIPFYDYRLEDYDLKKLQAVYAATYTAYADPTAWHDLMQRYGFRGLLLENGSPAETAGLLPLITVDPGWRLVYLDYAASFWIRSDQPQLPPAVDRTVVEDLATGITNFAQAENLNSFLEKTHRYPDIRLQILEQASRHGESATLLTDLGLLKMQSGHLAEADQLFNRVLRIKPRSQRTLATLAQIALSRGDNRAAEKYLQKALSYYPNDPELRENYDIVLRSIGK